MANRYWVGGTGNWDAATTTHWGSASGTEDNASVPTSADAVIFDASSGGGTCSVTATASCLSLTCGDFTGTLDTNDQAVNVTNIFSISGAGTRTITLGSSAISCGTWTATTTTNLTFDAETSTITQTGTFTIFNGGAQTYSTVILSGTTPTIAGANTFGALTRTGTAAVTCTLAFSANQTITGTLTINGNSAINRLLVKSSVVGTAFTITAATVTITNADFQDITGAGAGSWDLSAITGGSGDCEGNTDITFTTATTWYWHVDSGSVSDYTKWYTATNGGGSQMASTLVPLPQDPLHFDASSFDNASRTITHNMPRIGSIDFTGTTNTPNIVLQTTNYVFGSLTINSGLTMTSTNNYFYLSGRGNYNLTCGGFTFNCQVGTYAPGGTYTLQDTFLQQSAINKKLQILYGTFDANDQNLFVGGLSLSDSTSRGLYMGNGTWEVLFSGSDSIDCTDTTNLTFDAEGSTIKFTNNSITNKGIKAGGLTFNNIWIATQGTGAFSNMQSGTYNDYKIDAGRSVTFYANTTTTVTTFTALGSSGSHITAASSTTTHATLTKAGGGVISGCDYIDASYLTGSPANTWYIGSNSTDAVGSSLTNIYLLDEPPAVTTNSNFFQIL